MIFQGLLDARNCLRRETAPLTILAIKRELLRNFLRKNFQGPPFHRTYGTGLKFSIPIEF